MPRASRALDPAPRGPLRSAATRAAFRRALLAWYRGNARDLPWRRTSDAYAVWVSEIMLQQTRVEAVREYFRRFLAEFPTVADLAAAPLDRVLKLWEGLGYYRRAQLLHAAAQQIVEQHAGRMPSDADALADLPGVGRYTAAAVASIAFGQARAVLDGNVKRVLSRLLLRQEPVDDPRAAESYWQSAEALLDRRSPGDFNQAMMELGALRCAPRAPRCAACPVRRFCAANAASAQSQLPARRGRAAPRHIEWASAAIRRNGRLLWLQRPKSGLLAGLWELPGGPIEPGESPAHAIHRIIREQLGFELRSAHALGTLHYAFTHRTRRTHVFTAELPGRAPRRPAAPTSKAPRRIAAPPSSAAAARWLRRAELDRLALSTLDRKIANLVLTAGTPHNRAKQPARIAPACTDPHATNAP